MRELCAEYDLIHCVDPFEAVSVHGDMRYWRLHGRGSYSYRYTDADLAALRHMLTKSPQPGYLMFNNFSSKADAHAVPAVVLTVMLDRATGLDSIQAEAIPCSSRPNRFSALRLQGSPRCRVNRTS